MRQSVLHRYLQTTSSEFALSFIAFATLMSGGGLLWGILCVVFGVQMASIVPFGYVVLSAGNLLLWHQLGKFKFPRIFQVFISISLPFIFQWVLGGYARSGNVMLWSVLALVAQLTFSNFKDAIPWLIYFIALTVGSIYYNDYFELNGLIATHSAANERLFLVLNIGVVSTMIFFLAWFFIHNQRETVKKIAVKNDKLVSQKSILDSQRTELQDAYQELQMSEEELRQSMEELTVTNERVTSIKNDLEQALDREEYAKESLKKALGSEIAQKNEKIMSSLNYAKRIQTLLMPDEDEVISKFSDAFILLRPKDIVSGDFYWYKDVETEGHTKQIIAAVDSTGHGVPGALMSMIGLEQFPEIVTLEGIQEANLILDRLHKGVVRILKQESSKNRDGMDLAVCTINHKTKVLEYAGAKNPLVYIRDGKLHTIKGDRQPIGYVASLGAHKPFTKHEISFQEPTTFYLFSDGFPDQFGGEENRKFMAKNFKNLLLEIHKRPMAEQKTVLDGVLSKWMGNEHQTDDVLVIGFRLG